MTQKEKAQEVEQQVLSIEDIIPEPAEIKVKGKTYALRPVNLEDQVWIGKKFGHDTLQDLFGKGLPFDVVAQLVYRQMEMDGKRDFLAEEIEEIDDDGNVVTKPYKGWEKLMISIPGNESPAILEAYLKTVGISLPRLNEKVEAEKKNEKQAQKS